MSETKNVLVDKSFVFALDIITVYKTLQSNQNEYVLSKQLLRSGTSVGANIREAQNAQSKADFIHKLAISQKECDESCYWLELLIKAKHLRHSDFKRLHGQATEILKIIKRSILTIKQRHLTK